MDLLDQAFLNGAGVVTVVLAVGLLIMRGHLVPGRTHDAVVQAAKDQVDRAEERADRWETVALRALDATERLAQPVEVTAKVLTRFPNPSQEELAP